MTKLVGNIQGLAFEVEELTFDEFVEVETSSRFDEDQRIADEKIIELGLDKELLSNPELASVYDSVNPASFDDFDEYDVNLFENGFEDEDMEIIWNYVNNPDNFEEINFDRLDNPDYDDYDDLIDFDDVSFDLIDLDEDTLDEVIKKAETMDQVQEVTLDELLVQFDELLENEENEGVETMDCKYAVVLSDIWGLDDEDEDVLVVKKGDTVKIKEVKGSTVWLEVENWEWYVITKSENIKLIEKGESEMTNLKVGMTVSVELNYSEVVGKVTKVSDSDMFYLVDDNGTEYKFYSTINPVTILDKATFYGMEKVEVVNPEDHDFYDNAYQVSLNNYSPFSYGVFASCEQDALDAVVDYLVVKDMTGELYTCEEVIKLESEGYIDSFMNAGSTGHYVDLEHLYIKEVK